MVQSTNWSMFRLISSRSMLSWVSSWPMIEQPSGIFSRAACRSARVQLRLSPTILEGPAAVWMEKLLKIS